MSRELDELADKLSKSKPEGKGGSQRDEIMEAVLEAGAELFQSPDGEALASFDLVEGRETFLLKSADLRRRIQHLYFQRTERGASEGALKEAISTLEARARFGSVIHPTGVRVVELGGSIWIDRGGAEWDAIRVHAGGWEIVARSPVRFYRPPKLGELPRPIPGGSIARLREYVNCASEDDFRLLLAWILWVFRSSQPVPILILQGEQGSAKTTTARIVQSLTDPGSPALRSPPKNEEDLIVAARSRRILAFDNLSGLSGWLGDALCRLCTGGGYGTRQRFTDLEEVLFEGTRAIILTGIDDVARAAHDLADRSLVLTLPRISETARKGGGDLESRFEADRDSIFAGVLDALAEGLGNLAALRVDRLPRMAEFARLALAAERAIGFEPGGFMAAYEGNRLDAATESLDGDVVGLAVARLMEGVETWSGSASDLLAELRRPRLGSVDPAALPRVPQHLSERLKRAAPVLRRVAGIEVESGKVGSGGKRRRVITLNRAPGYIDRIDRIDPAPSLGGVSTGRGAVRRAAPSGQSWAAPRAPGPVRDDPVDPRDPHE